MATLAQRVHATNQIEKIAFDNIQKLLPQLKEYNGKKIFLADGRTKAKSFKVEFADTKPEKFTPDDYVKIHRLAISKSMYSVYLDITICSKESDHTCFYTDKSVYLGEYKDNAFVLNTDQLEDFPEPKNYNANEVQSKLNQIKELENQISKIKSEVYQFTR